MKLFKRWGAISLLVALSITLAYATVTYVQSFTVGGSYVWILDRDGSTSQTGPQKFGSTPTGSAVTLPTVATGSQFGTWIPAYNAGPAVTQGTVMCSSTTGTAYVGICTASSGLTSVAGVAAESIASATKGWIIPLGGGYAVVKTTGTVAIGDVLVTTVSAAGYLATNNTPTSGTAVAVAMSAGTAAGGTALAIMK